MNTDTINAALWSMRALQRELDSRARSAAADGLVWAPDATAHAKMNAESLQRLERLAEQFARNPDPGACT